MTNILSSEVVDGACRIPAEAFWYRDMIPPTLPTIKHASQGESNADQGSEGQAAHSLSAQEVDRLLVAARTNGPSIQISLTRGMVSLMITNLTVGITNRVERSFDLSDPGGWSVVSTFVSPATATNRTEVYDPDCPKAFYRVSSVVSGK